MKCAFASLLNVDIYYKKKATIRHCAAKYFSHITQSALFNPSNRLIHKYTPTFQMEKPRLRDVK